MLEQINQFHRKMNLDFKVKPDEIIENFENVKTVQNKDID